MRIFSVSLVVIMTGLLGSVYAGPGDDKRPAAKETVSKVAAAFNPAEFEWPEEFDPLILNLGSNAAVRVVNQILLGQPVDYDLIRTQKAYDKLRGILLRFQGILNIQGHAAASAFLRDCLDELNNSFGAVVPPAASMPANQQQVSKKRKDPPQDSRKPADK